MADLSMWKAKHDLAEDMAVVRFAVSDGCLLDPTIAMRLMHEIEHMHIMYGQMRKSYINMMNQRDELLAEKGIWPTGSDAT